jgi:ADP-heptose:LPS heptosyltransferase
MTKYSKLYIHDGGGVGDIIKHYVQGTRGWGLLKPLKEKYPDVEIKAMLTCINPQAQELIKYHPSISLIEPYLWSHPARSPLRRLIEEKKGDYVSLLEATKMLEGLEPTKPEVYLNAEDQEVVSSIISQGKYIFIHPFSGEPWRAAFSMEQYPALIDRLIDDAGYNVVIVGGSYKKNWVKSAFMKEEFSYERPGLFNLVNKTNVRQCVTLSRSSAGFVGTWSCHLCAILDTSIRTIVVFPNSHKKKKFGLAEDNWVCRIKTDSTPEDYRQYISSIVKHFETDGT